MYQNREETTPNFEFQLKPSVIPSLQLLFSNWPRFNDTNCAIIFLE